MGVVDAHSWNHGQVATQMAWTALLVIGEIVCTVTVLVFMLRHKVRFDFPSIAYFSSLILIAGETLS